MKKLFWVILIIAGLGIIYTILGYGFKVVPVKHCGIAKIPNGSVYFCDWYTGPDRVY